MYISSRHRSEQKWGVLNEMQMYNDTIQRDCQACQGNYKHLIIQGLNRDRLKSQRNQ